MANPHHTIIIAEGGVNHNGSLEMALKLVREAAAAGADYVKFQTFKAERLVSPSARKADYQREACGEGSQLDMLRRLELSENDFEKIAGECRRCGIGFMSTPFDDESIDALNRIGMDYWKIPSGEITNLPYLRKVASKGGKIILSTGMSTLAEVAEALRALTAAGAKTSEIYLLHCTTQYPAPYESVNLRAMDTLRSLPCAGVGYSDHTRGTEVAVAAAALGAEIIEKHFTLDRSLPGPDHQASLNPVELREMVSQIRHIELALGSGEKIVAEAERGNIAVARRSIVARNRIEKGEILSEKNLAALRPGDGLSPMMWDEVVGTRAIRAFEAGEQIEL